jgi:hypothetical protein
MINSGAINSRSLELMIEVELAWRRNVICLVSKTCHRLHRFIREICGWLSHLSALSVVVGVAMPGI